MIYIDFETRSELDLLSVGAWKYSCHPSTEIICMAFKIIEEPAEILAIDEINKRWDDITKDYLDYCDSNELKRQFIEYIIELGNFEAHNAFFEFAIWHNILVQRYQWPAIPDDHWYCSAAKAAYHGLPRKLEDVALALDLVNKKDNEGHRLMLQMSKPRSTWKKHGRGSKWFEDEKRLNRLYQYCKQDVETEYELSCALDELPKTERKLWLLDQKINRRGIYCDVELAKSAVSIIETLETDANKELYEITDGMVSTPGQIDKIIDWLVGENIGIPNLQAPVVSEFLERDDLTPRARRVLEIRQLHARSATDKYYAMIEGADDDNRLRDLLFYYGAHTGRWTGKRVQPTNMYTPVFSQSEIEYIIVDAIKRRDIDELTWLFGDPIVPLSSALRATICAKPGYDLIGADYDGIEACVLLWRVGDTEALEKIRNGIDLYVDLASIIYQIDYEELIYLIKKKDKDAIFKRTVGKTTFLSAIYQVGATTLKKRFDKYKIEVDDLFTEKLIYIFRQKYKKIVNHWYWLNDCAIEKKGPFSIKNKFLQFQLPSGRKLQYYDPELTLNRFHRPALSYMAIDSASKKWRREQTYGGKLTENETQATSRDIMIMGMLRAENAGYPIIFNVYDELIAEIHKSFGSIDEFVSLLCKGSKWTKGCPISAEGWRGKRYRK